ncbi:Oidioi.mRNA.OKI2018_I69.XSR.g15397.t1.cds [Oikopleura dioica]|uniref:Oidioi.mRNA.OKI2018_I69.XSR.g15397.t1.cds n=1 Tax=Oikopleura dioica TaxID=34765 RepID=A0ABN7SLX3_OIKDI|nr:Oidioi.mRNA.OKI2018_I69.XSR.g15397.t1.cds [Oikopleura dioica]
MEFLIHFLILHLAAEELLNETGVTIDEHHEDEAICGECVQRCGNCYHCVDCLKYSLLFGRLFCQPLEYMLNTWTGPCEECTTCLKGTCDQFAHCNKCTFCLGCLKNPTRPDCWNCLQCRPCSLAIGCSPTAKAFGEIIFGTSDHTKESSANIKKPLLDSIDGIMTVC